MHHLDREEQIQHRTGDVPLAYYGVDARFPRYRMQTHWHRETELVRVNSGRMTLFLDGAELQVQPGDVLAIGSGVIHSGEPDRCVYQCIVFDPLALAPSIESVNRAMQLLVRNNIYLKQARIDAAPAFRQAIDQLFALCQQGFAGREAELLGAVFAFVGEMARNLDGARLDMVSERIWQHAERLKPALEYIRGHYSQHISLETLARLSGFSPRYFCRYFRAILHRSPIDYLNYYRAECAAHYLANADMNVAEVAALCGYADSSTFIKQFKKYKNITPKQYKMYL